MSKKKFDIVGLKFSHILVVEELYTDNNYRTYYRCLCDCGVECIKRKDFILSKKEISCGCLSYVGKILPNYKANISRLFRIYKKRGNESGKGFSLSRKEFESFIFKNCSYCGASPNNKLKIVSKYETKTMLYNGIDRIDSSKGYHIENCNTCCAICNIAKCDMSLQEFYTWIIRVFFFLIRGNIVI
jgi:hypothetical protein